MDTPDNPTGILVSANSQKVGSKSEQSRTISVLVPALSFESEVMAAGQRMMVGTRMPPS